MGGVADITREPHVTWTPQGWLFDAAVRGLAHQLRQDHPDLAVRLADSEIEDGGGYVDWRALPPEQFIALRSAADSMLNAAIERGPAPGAEPSAYRRLIYGLSLLRALLRDDPRSGENGDGRGTLAVGAGDPWIAPAVVFDLALEHLAGVLRPSSSSAAAALLTGRAEGHADLQAIPPDSFVRLLGAADWMSERYAPHAALEARAERFLSQAHPALCQLAAQLRADPRAAAD